MKMWSHNADTNDFEIYDDKGWLIALIKLEFKDACAIMRAVDRLKEIAFDEGYEHAKNKIKRAFDDNIL